MQNYLREHSTGSVLRNSVRIYKHHFLTILLTYALPTLPFLIAQQEAQVAGHIPLFVILTLMNAFMGFFAFGAITITLSDICLGERPGVLRSYRRLSGATLRKLLWANLIALFLILGAYLLLIVPGIILTLRLAFTSVIATLEDLGGRKALKRSAVLGKGHHLRTGAIFLVWVCAAMVLFMLLGVLIGIAGVLVERDLSESVGLRIAIAMMVAGFLYPMLFISTILMYYDLRVRKEAYDLSALAEDLRR